MEVALMQLKRSFEEHLSCDGMVSTAVETLSSIPCWDFEIANVIPSDLAAYE